MRKFRAHAALVVGSAAFSALMIGIVLNATVMQKEHHPAPLFGSAAPPVRAAAAPVQAPAPQPVPAVAAPAAIAAAPAIPATSEAAAPVPSRPRAAAEAVTPKPKSPVTPHRAGKEHDAIAHLLGKPAAAKPKPASSPARPDAAPVRPVHARPLPPAQ